MANEWEVQNESPAPAAQQSQAGQPVSNSDWQVVNEAPVEQTPDTGEQINDVGNKVIVPKEGESFADTIKRAADYGKTVTPGQVNAEVRTMPGKAATVLAAAPVIGAAGAASLAGAGEVGAAIPSLPASAEKLLQISEHALEHLAENYPQLTKLAGRLGYGAGAAGAYKLLNKLGIH